MRKLLLVTMCMALCACSIKYTKSTDGHEIGWEFMQMQVAEDSASVYSTTVIGMKIRMISKNNPAPEIQLGYIRDARALVPKKDADGTGLCDVVIDTGVNPFNKEGVTDTIATGDPATELYVIESEDNTSEGDD